METKTTPVVLLLADISGYTQFMLSHHKAPIHGQMIIAGLFETLMRQIDHPVKIVELEGDALFLYAPKTSDEATWERRSTHLVDLVLKLFEAFRTRLAELKAYSVCRCGACANLSELKLKVVAHSGEALRNQVGEFSVLSGVDVITVHRLLKNSVAESQYFLMSESAHRDLSFPEGAEVLALSANVRETRSTQRIRVGRRQRKRTCWDCEREWKRMVVPLEPGRPSEARQLLRTRR